MKIIKSKGKVPKDIAASEAEDEQPERQAPAKAGKPMDSARMQAEIEKLKAQVEVLSQIRAAMNEKFSRTDERLGELRAMSAQSEKEMAAIKVSAAKAIDAITETKPERLVAEIQKRDARISSLEAKMDVLFKTNEEVMKQLKEVTLKYKTFKGLEEVQGMAKDAAKDLAAMKTVQAKIDVDSSKVEKIFVDTQKKYAEMDRLKSISETLSKSYADVLKEINGLKVKMAGLPDRPQLDDMKKLLSQKSEMLSKLPKEDMKSMRDFLAKAGYLDKQVSDIRSKLDDMINVIELFSSKVNAVQKDLSDMKTGQTSKGMEAKVFPQAVSEIAGRLPKLERENQDLKSRLDEMEGIIEQISGRLKEARPGGLSSKADYKEIQDLKSRLDEMEGVLEQMSGRLKEAKPAPAPKAEPRETKAIIDKVSGLENAMQDAIKGMSEKMRSLDSGISGLKEQSESIRDPKALGVRLEVMDSRIAGMNDKLLKLSEDAQKLSSYFLEGMNQMATRLKSIELERGPSPAIPRARPYPQPAAMPAPKPVPSKPQFAPAQMPRPPPPARMPPQLPAPPVPPHPPSTIFTKLRESTVIRMPEPDSLSPDEEEDLDILKDHITEGLQKRESKEKILRDLLNAGFDEQLVSRAFRQARAG